MNQMFLDSEGSFDFREYVQELLRSLDGTVNYIISDIIIVKIENLPFLFKNYPFFHLPFFSKSTRFSYLPFFLPSKKKRLIFNLPFF